MFCCLYTSAVFPHPWSVVAGLSIACLLGNRDDGKLPVTDLALSLGYPKPCIQTGLTSDAGAGAGAGAGANAGHLLPLITYLSWFSRCRGLRLQFADISLPESRSSPLWNVGPSSDIEFSPLQGITAGKPNNSHFVEDENFFAHCARDGVKNNIDKRNPLSQSPKCNTRIMKSKCNIGNTGLRETMSHTVETSNVSANQQSVEIRNGDEKGVCGPIRIQTAAHAIMSKSPTLSGHGNERMVNLPLLKLTDYGPIVEQTGPSSEEPNKRISSNIHDGFPDVDSGNQGRLELVLASKNHNQCINRDTLSLTSNSTSRGRRELACTDKHEKKCEMPNPGSNSAPLLEKLESSDENDLQPAVHKDTYNEASKSVAVDSTFEVKNGSEQAGVVLPQGNDIPIKASPINSRVHMCHRKGKEKALSDGDVNGRMSVGDDDSHESVESCNSAGLSSAGKKRWSIQQQLFVGSKRVKRQVEESPCSTSYDIQDSSFMTWISNMMRGLSKSDQIDTPLALTLAHLDHRDEGHDQKSNACKRNQDAGCKNTGFQNIFQSLYFPNAKRETRTISDDNLTGEVSKKLDLAIRECDIKVSSVACSGEKINKQFFLSNKKFNQPTSANGEGSSCQRKILCATFDIEDGNCKMTSDEKKDSCEQACGTHKDGDDSSGSSLGKRKTTSPETNDVDVTYGGKGSYDYSYRNDPLGNLWITQLSSKSCGVQINMDACNQSAEANACTIQHERVIAHSKSSHDCFESKDFLEGPLNVVGKELPVCASNTETSFGLERIKTNADQKSVCRLNPILPSQRLKISEAMASVFARRLDALKHIIPSDAKGRTTPAPTICFFCGTKGHDLRDCSEVMESELEDLLKNVKSYDSVEGSACLCIRCFQLNHWAVACPTLSSKRRHQSQCNQAIDNNFSFTKLLFSSNSKPNPKLLESKGNQQVGVVHTSSNLKETRAETVVDLEKKLITVTSDPKSSVSSPGKKCIASSSGKPESCKSQTGFLQNFVNRQISELPTRIFETIKKLRLSRADILKWMNSHRSLSQLDGYFLRLRLNKREEGLGGTGYHVASITGAHEERSIENSNRSISVSVGGVKYIVESQYLSNHDFLEVNSGLVLLL
ncbi:Plus-3 domain, partial [Dillenia turbinata]